VADEAGSKRQVPIVPKEVSGWLSLQGAPESTPRTLPDTGEERKPHTTQQTAICPLEKEMNLFC